MVVHMYTMWNVLRMCTPNVPKIAFLIMLALFLPLSSVIIPEIMLA